MNNAPAWVSVDPAPSGTLLPGMSWTIRATASQAVQWPAAPQLALDLDGRPSAAPITLDAVSTNPSETVEFRYTVGPNDLDENGVTWRLSPGTGLTSALNQAPLDPPVFNFSAMRNGETPATAGAPSQPSGAYSLRPGSQGSMAWVLTYSRPVTLSGAAPTITPFIADAARQPIPFTLSDDRRTLTASYTVS